MILYFSATGNSKYVAERIAKVSGERAVSIIDLVQSDSCSIEIGRGESFGIISPTYYWGLPTIMCEFLSKLEIKTEKSPYVYFVATYGTTTGQIGRYANEHMAKKGYPFDAVYSVKMPDTWTPTFDLSDVEKVKRINVAAESEINELINSIQKKEKGDFMRHKVPQFAVKIYYRTYEEKRKTSHFIVEKTCIGCGLCEKKCPVEAIKIENGKPVWAKEKCTMCLGCLHRCPKFSIQYGKNTKKHGQYVHPGVEM